VKPNIKSFVIGALISLVVLLGIDTSISDFFYNSTIGGNLMDYQITPFEIFWSLCFVVLLLLFTSVYVLFTRKRKAYRLHGKGRFISKTLGIIVANAFIISPIFQHNDYIIALSCILVLIVLIRAQHLLFVPR